MDDLELIEGEGWILKTEKIPEICTSCKNKLETPFFFCNELKQFFCSECENKRPERVCYSREKEHEHFKIIELKKL